MIAVRAAIGATEREQKTMQEQHVGNEIVEPSLTFGGSSAPVAPLPVPGASSQKLSNELGTRAVVIYAFNAQVARARAGLALLF